ncbi:DUF6799 domain-containing protein [Hymenobacter cellulosivorans]|uniref:DUF6799 domain-containing protein n=1 Tax=Hymenobacter cellulosivorans TaxID=2932249 RepID=A0ABY4FB56_9BACT|nr:DUF6799 domain-containing protein [Hymenobacter cellulosivorans]UOQ53728.1 hypothetical protein MUN80_02965 [Hymenobacter cellulosivorans]
MPSFARILLLCCLTSSLSGLAQSRGRNDGFQRRDGGMFIIRNGAPRPMTRDVHLPNGRVITRDGFVVARDGRRTELAEGKGCDLAGNVVQVTGEVGGPLRLAAVPRPAASAVRAPISAEAYLRQLVNGGKRRGWGHQKKGKHGKGKHKKHDH